jgi:hypothetical protein
MESWIVIEIAWNKIIIAVILTKITYAKANNSI